MNISDLFKTVGAPLANKRWSWGGVREDGSIILRVWQNECKRIDGVTYICLTHHKEFVGREMDLGYQERIRHVNQILAGSKCYMIMCVPKDANQISREIDSFNKKELLIAGKAVELDGDTWVSFIAREPI